MSSAWTEERTQELTILWGNGASVVDIAAQLQCSRNAVIGKADRLGLPQHANYKRTDHPHQSSRPEPPRVASYDQPHIVALLQLTHNMCRFPIDDGRYCGELTDGRRSYCGKHYRLAHTHQALPAISMVPVDTAFEDGPPIQELSHCFA